MNHTRTGVGDRDLVLATCEECGLATYVPHAHVVMGLRVVCKRAHRGVSMVTDVRVSEPPKRRRQKFAKEAKRQSNQQDMANRVVRHQPVEHRTLLAAKVRPEVLDQLMALKQRLEAGE